MSRPRVSVLLPVRHEEPRARLRELAADLELVEGEGFVAAA